MNNSKIIDLFNQDKNWIEKILHVLGFQTLIPLFKINYPFGNPIKILSRVMLNRIVLWSYLHYYFSKAEQDRIYQLCNTFFMETISSLSFRDNTSPSEEAVGILMEYVIEQQDTSEQIILRTKVSMISDETDDTVVARSFILHLLMRSR